MKTHPAISSANYPLSKLLVQFLAFHIMHFYVAHQCILGVVILSSDSFNVEKSWKNNMFRSPSLMSSVIIRDECTIQIPPYFFKKFEDFLGRGLKVGGCSIVIYLKRESLNNPCLFSFQGFIQSRIGSLCTNCST